jgi:hypothetical protein
MWQLDISLPHTEIKVLKAYLVSCLYTADKGLEIEVLSVTYVYIVL